MNGTQYLFWLKLKSNASGLVHASAAVKKTSNWTSKDEEVSSEVSGEGRVSVEVVNVRSVARRERICSDL